MTWEELRKSVEVFGLSRSATLDQIRKRHRELVHRHHPDHGSADPDAIREINEAYRILREYCANYSFSLTREEFLIQNPEERLRLQFASDPVWGGGA